jgi:hypothetical protein
MRRSVLHAALALTLLPGVAAAQGYLLRLDSRVQSVAYRGVKLDSIPLANTVTTAGGGRETPDGFAADCANGAVACTFYRPGGERRGGPMVTSADLTAWGLGISRLSLHASARLGVDLGTSDVWPGTDPAVQLLEGYLDYAAEWYDVRAGRQIESGRLGYTGYDGGAFTARSASTGLSGKVYGGWGLARATALPVTAGALNPLDEFQPRQRQWVAGFAGEWQHARASARFDYQREVDRDTRNLVSERIALSATARPLDTHWLLSAGSEYDLARDQWGTSDISVRYARNRWNASAGARYYRPYFDLWTIWGVFSPVGYTAVNGTVALQPAKGLELTGSGERFWYAETFATTPLEPVEDRGWRWTAGLGYAIRSGWHAGGAYHAEYGPGAASKGWDAHLSWQPAPVFSISADGGHLVRPLEFRYDEAALDWVGAHADIKPTDRLRFGLSATRYMEDRRRPDAAAFSWDQTRIVASVTWLIGSGADRLPLPPAVRRRGER